LSGFVRNSDLLLIYLIVTVSVFTSGKFLQNLAISLLTTINLYSDIYANQSTKEAVFIVSQNLGMFLK